MNLQTIKSMDGKVEYVLLPVAAYQALRHQITEQLKQAKEDQEYNMRYLIRLITSIILLP